MKKLCVLAMLTMSVFWGCATRQATYVSPQDQSSISTDLHLADFQEMCRDLLKKMQNHQDLIEILDRGAVAFIGGIENRTYDHLDTRAFGENLKRQLLAHGSWRMIEPRHIDDVLDRWELRRSGLVDRDTAMKVGKLTDAGFMFTGAVTSSHQRQGRKTDVAYQLTLELLSLDNGELVWVGQTSVRKQFKRGIIGR